MIPDDFVVPPEPRYVDRAGNCRAPSEYETVEYKRKVIFALAKHLDWGDYLGDLPPVPTAGNRLRVTMKFERGERFYYVEDEPPGDPLERQRPNSFGSPV